MIYNGFLGFLGTLPPFPPKMFGKLLIAKRFLDFSILNLSKLLSKAAVSNIAAAFVFVDYNFDRCGYSTAWQDGGCLPKFFSWLRAVCRRIH